MEKIYATKEEAEVLADLQAKDRALRDMLNHLVDMTASNAKEQQKWWHGIEARLELNLAKCKYKANSDTREILLLGEEG